MKVSIIVPVYNVERVLHYCINSILNQTYKDYELILVNDGSSDNSGEICNQFAKENSKITVIHNKNGGVSKARNAGIGCAKGEYICFIDSDDYISETFLEEIVKKIDAGYNFALTAYQWVSDYDYSATKTVLFKNVDYSIIDKYDLLHIGNLVLLPQPWNKIFKKSIILDNNIRMPEDLSLGEDTVFVYRYLSCIISENYAVINKPLYYYYSKNNKSLLNKYRDDLFEVYKKLNRYLYEEIIKWNLPEEQMRLFYNGCYYRMENVLHNTFRKENPLSTKEKIAYNSKIIRSNGFQYWLNKSTSRINPFFRIAYLIKSYYPIYLFHRIKGESVDK